MITCRQLIAEVRKPGRIEMTVVAQHDPFRVVVEKTDLLRILGEMPADSAAPWCFCGEPHPDGTRTLDTQDDRDFDL